MGAIALLYPPIVIDDSSWKNTAENFTVALTLTLGGGEGGGVYESAIAPNYVEWQLSRRVILKNCFEYFNSAK